MGTTHSDITETEFKKFWQQSDSLDGLTIWENKDNPVHQLEQYLIRNDDSPDFEELYHLRKNNPYLINAYALKHDGLSCGVDHETQNIFIERIRLRLSNLKDIPYPDALHLYDAVLHGFSQLSEVVGCFHVDEDQIGINQLGQVKVWLSSAFQSSRVATGQRVTEAQMLQEINQILRSAVDTQTFPSGQPNIVQYMSNPIPSNSFSQANNRFVNYIRQFTGGQVPMAFACVEENGGAGNINQWCRTNSSHGFDINNMRLSQKIYQSQYTNKLTRSKSSKLYESIRNSTYRVSNNQQGSNQINQNNAALVETVFIRNDESGANQSIIRNQQKVQAPRYSLSSNDNIVPRAPLEPQNEIINAPIYTPPVQMFRESQVVSSINNVQPAPIQRQVILQSIPEQAYSRIQVIQRPEYVQRVQQGSQVVFQNQGSQVKFQSQPQPIQYQQQQTLISSPSRTKIQIQPNVQPQIQPPASVKFQTQTISNNIAQIPTYSNSPSRVQPNFTQTYNSLSDGIQQAESRLQQQRVISQTIQVKQAQKTNEGSKLTTDYNDYKTPANFDWLDYYKTNDVYSQSLKTIGNIIPEPTSTTIEKKTYAPAEDGKSSAEFLALIGQLKSGISTGKSQFNEVYSQSQTPISYKQNSGSKKDIVSYAYDTYSQDFKSGYGQDSSNKNIESTFKYDTDSYKFDADAYKYDTKFDYKSFISKYDTNLDPQLEADLQRYK